MPVKKDWIFLGVLGAILVGLAVTVRTGAINLDRDDDVRREEEVTRRFPGTFREISGLRYLVLRPGDGARPYTGSVVTVAYTMTTLDGQLLDSTERQGSPMRFRVGRSQVVRGLDEGLLGMRVGERRRLLVPPALAFGRAGREPDIPPDCTLVFDVELLAME